MATTTESSAGDPRGTYTSSALEVVVEVVVVEVVLVAAAVVAENDVTCTLGAGDIDALPAAGPSVLMRTASAACGAGGGGGGAEWAKRQKKRDKTKREKRP